ncbi:hypothetical protein AB6D15_15520 [Vibrio splendidus]
MWFVSKHALRQAALGKQQHNEFMTLLQQFVAELNKPFPFDQETGSMSCDKTSRDTIASEINRFD